MNFHRDKDSMRDAQLSVKTVFLGRGHCWCSIFIRAIHSTDLYCWLWLARIAMFKCPATCKPVIDRLNLPSLIAKNTSNAASVTGRNTEDKLKKKKAEWRQRSKENVAQWKVLSILMWGILPYPAVTSVNKTFGVAAENFCPTAHKSKL